MKTLFLNQSARAATLSLVALSLAACGADDGDPEPDGSAFVLSSVVIDADGNRTTYVQTISSLDDGPFTNDAAIELPGNGVVMAGGGHFYVGLAEEPTWIRFSPDQDGGIAESGRLSLLNLGATRIDYGNALVDAETAVSVLSEQAIAVVWNPATMEILGEVDLGFLVQEGYSLEVWTTTAHDGLVYVPARWSDWAGGRIRAGVSTTIIDPAAMSVVGVAEDDRCASGGRVVFDQAGYAYVMGDGRNYSIHMFANAGGAIAPDNCIVRIPPGETDFEAEFFHTIPALTGGLQSITELETARPGTGVGFAKMFYPDELPDGVEPVDFGFWGYPAHKLWRIELTDPPTARAVNGAPFSTIGFAGSTFDGYLYSGESPDGDTTAVYEIDPDANTAALRFSMDGYFNGLYALSR
ncbi:hypothetical protein [Haliangium sp.]|uniref:hypothetical protein n=1 Tax=Haliangium sp. TaxID=2663208 RepID=UPI003D0C30B6